jgi:hypothetical protein
MITTSVEFQDFTVGETTREYRLRVRRGTEFHSFTVTIPNEAFVSGRVRYQDAPEICYLKIQREMAACGEDGLPAPALVMTDQELEEYRVAHAPKNPGRRL